MLSATPRQFPRRNCALSMEPFVFDRALDKLRGIAHSEIGILRVVDFQNLNEVMVLRLDLRQKGAEKRQLVM